MHKKIFTIIMSVFVFFIILFLLSPMVVSDGCVFIPTVDEWIMSYEENQIGFIQYKNGIENLTVVIDVKNSSLNADQAFWIFPIPCNPDNADIDIISDIPFYRDGYTDVRDSTKSAITNSLIFMTFTQPYVGFLPILFLLSGSIMSAEGYNDLTIHEHVEKMGLTSELITANNSESIDLYLEQKSISLSNGALEIIEEYIGQDCSFVVSWISDLEAFKESANADYNQHWYYYGEEFYILGITVNFPSDEIYYPLKFTSLYGQKIIPILIQINGYVTPKNTFNEMQTSYYLDGDTEYTEITILTESNDFTDDLWIENKEPASIQNAKFINSNIILFTLIIFIISSLLASIFSSYIVYFKNKPIIWKFTVMGFGNFLSIFFVFVLCFLLKINYKFLKIPLEKKRKVTKGFELGFRITFLVLGLICLAFILSTFIIGFFGIFIALVIAFVIGILMFIYGGIKDPRVTLYTGLFSLFFFIFLLLSNSIIQTML